MSGTTPSSSEESSKKRTRFLLTKQSKLGCYTCKCVGDKLSLDEHTDLIPERDESSAMKSDLRACGARDLVGYVPATRHLLHSFWEINLLPIRHSRAKVVTATAAWQSLPYLRPFRLFPGHDLNSSVTSDLAAPF